MNPILLAVIVFLLALGAGLVAVSEADKRSYARASRRRLKYAVLSARSSRDVTARPRTPKLAKAVWAGLQSWAEVLLPPDVWGARPPLARLLGVGFGAGAALAVTAQFLLHLPAWVGALAFVGALPSAPWMMAARANSKMARKFEEMFPETIDHLIRMLQAGLPVTSSIRRLGRDSGPPVGRVYEEVANWLDVGIPLSQALLMTGKRLKVKPFDFFGAALSIQSASGGNLIETLESLSAIMRERQLQGAKIRALTGEARTTATIITLLPLMAGLALRIVLPDYVGVLFEPRSLPVLIGASASYVTGIVVVRGMLARLTMS